MLRFEGGSLPRQPIPNIMCRASDGAMWTAFQLVWTSAPCPPALPPITSPQDMPMVIKECYPPDGAGRLLYTLHKQLPRSRVRLDREVPAHTATTNDTQPIRPDPIPTAQPVTKQTCTTQPIPHDPICHATYYARPCMLACGAPPVLDVPMPGSVVGCCSLISSVVEKPGAHVLCGEGRGTGHGARGLIY